MIKVALIGNPNVGKSTLFNELTGLKQHTGNWNGKTVGTAIGYKRYNNVDFEIYDLPGTYSLIPHSEEEKVTSDFVLSKDYDVALVVCDPICLERNLQLVIQTLQVTKNVIVCINLIDEAKKNKITIDIEKLSTYLDIDVVPISAREKIGIDKLLASLSDYKESNFDIKYNEKIEDVISIIKTKSKFESIKTIIENKCVDYIFEVDQITKYLNEEKISFNDEVMHTVSKKCSEIINDIYKKECITNKFNLDKILTNKITGIPIMILMIMFIFWISIVGANYPSNLLFAIFNYFGDFLKNVCTNIDIPSYIYSPIIDGIYRVLSWVIAVMFPPMAIFFPLFTILEDYGILPRIAFNLDGYFEKNGACGKQSLTMCMGIGCNAVGVTGARIIDSKRERLLAILTNSFIPCNGRFPTLIAIFTMFFSITNNSILNKTINVILLTVVIIFSVFITFIISKILSRTILKGKTSFFLLELPLYRKPKIISVVVRSLFDRTLKILIRAIVVAAPAGLIIWLITNITINNLTILNHLSNILNPIGVLIGLDGIVLSAFLLGFPANEIVLPIILMGYMSLGVMTDINDLNALKTILMRNGWDIITAICMIIFCIFHFPCSTTIITIYKETKSLLWTILSFVLPLTIGFILCFIVNLLSIIIV